MQNSSASENGSKRHQRNIVFQAECFSLILPTTASRCVFGVFLSSVCFFRFFQAKSGATNNHRNGSSDKIL